jgi:predicted dehydrogenase
MIRIGVLGTARAVSHGLLAPAKETPGVEVSAVGSRTLPKAEAFAARHGIPRGFGSYEALLESADIDAVYIALPPALHFDWARRAMESGKHVLCEKPLAENARLAQELALSARQYGRVLVEVMHLRYLDLIHRQRELAVSGQFGKVLRIESCFRTPYMRMAKDDFRLRFELGGGAGLDLGCYAVSSVRYLAGEEPEVLSVRHKRSGPQVDRWMRAMLRFPSGVEGAVEFGFRGFYMPRVGIVVTCEDGWIKWDGRANALAHSKGRNSQFNHGSARTKPANQLQLEEFVKSVRGEKSDTLPTEDAILTARVLDAMYEKAGLALRGPQQAS